MPSSSLEHSLKQSKSDFHESNTISTITLQNSNYSPIILNGLIMDMDSLPTKNESISLLTPNYAKISFDFILILLQQDTLDDTKNTNSSPETIGGLAFKQI